MATSAQRLEMGAVMDYLLAHRAKVHYAQVRPMTTRNIKTLIQLHEAIESERGVTMDCSEAATLVCKLAGLKDPSGLFYSGAGYTGTMLDNLPHYYSPRSAMLGALVVFGPYPGHHVAIVREPGDNPLLWSHGSEADPRTIRLSLERQGQPAPVTFLSIAGL